MLKPAVKERPLPFMAEMIRALQAGNKTQTRRLVKRQPPADVRSDHTGVYTVSEGDDGAMFRRDIPCPYGKPGDRLWVRESWRDTGETGASYLQAEIQYAADGARIMSPVLTPEERAKARHSVDYRQPMFMPRWASRFLLELQAVRIERLQAISDEDCLAEGILYDPFGRGDGYYGLPDWKHDCSDPQTAYQTLIEQINGAGTWRANPWVWVLDFKRLEAADAL